MRAKLIRAANDVPIHLTSPLKLKSMITQAHLKMTEENNCWWVRKYKKKKK